MTSVLPPKHSAGRRGALALRHLVLLGFAGFFIIPLVWLVLAPTKTDYDLITRSPLALGNLHNVQIAWQNLNAFGNHIYWRWMENSLLYSLSATALALVTVIPAGYGLAIGSFRGRKLILTLTLVAIVMPAASLVLPIFLELNAMGLIGNALSIILPFAFFPFGVYLSYIYYATALPPARPGRGADRRVQRVGGFPSRRDPPGEADHRARRLLQLRRQLEQLLPAVRDPAERKAVSGTGRAVGHLRIDAAHACTRGADSGASRPDRVHRLPAGARSRVRHSRKQV